MKINNIPVFYHIPKNSGTYVYNCIFHGLRLIYKKILVIRVLDGKFVLAKIIISDNDAFLNYRNRFTIPNNFKTILDLNIEDLTGDVIEKFSILAIMIESRGFRRADSLLDLFTQKLSKFNLNKFIILREPFSREQSLYNYLTSDKSKHEPAHGIFKSASFEEYLVSKQLQDSWLIRNLSNVPMSEQLTEDHFNTACEKMQNLNAYDIKDTDKAIKETLLKCFNIQDFDTDAVINKKHENTYKKIKFSELPLDTQNIFKKRKYWDQKLHDHILNE